MIYKSIYLAKRNPTIAPEDWPAAWRSHPRTVAKMANVGAAIGAAIDTINYCARVRAPMLDGAPFAPAGVSVEHDGVAVVSSRSEALLQIGADRAGQEEVIADEVRVFGRPADEFSLACQETLALGGPPGQAAVIRFLARKPGETAEGFQAALAGRPAELARAAVADGRLVRYAHNRPARTPPPGYVFDAIAESWFESVDDAVRSFVDPTLRALAQALDEVCDTAASVTMLTEVVYRVPRA